VENDWKGYGKAIKNFDSFQKGKCSISYIINFLKTDDPIYYDRMFKKNVYYVIRNILLNNIFNYDTTKSLFEINHFTTYHPVYNIVENENNELLKTSFISLYNNIYCYIIDENGNKIKQKFICQWLYLDTKKRYYEKIIFSPLNLECLDNYGIKRINSNGEPLYYNAFKGLDASFLDKEIITPKTEQELLAVLAFIKRQLCDDNEDFYNYLLKWMAIQIQKPGTKTRVVPIIKSDQGIGKTMFFEWFGKCIIGKKYFISIIRGEDLFGHFNSQLENKLFILYEETSAKDTFQNGEQLKGVITNTTQSITPKGQETREVENNLNMICCTNHNVPCNIEATDRRFTGIDTNALRLTREESLYFGNELLSHVNPNKPLIASFYYYLLEKIDITNFNCEQDRVMTDFYEQVKYMSCNTILTFMAYYIEKNNVDHCESLENLFSNYKRWNEEYNGNVKAYSKKSFSMKLRSIKSISEELKDTKKSDGKRQRLKMLSFIFKDIYNELEEKGAIDKPKHQKPISLLSKCEN